MVTSRKEGTALPALGRWGKAMSSVDQALPLSTDGEHCHAFTSNPFLIGFTSRRFLIAATCRTNRQTQLGRSAALRTPAAQLINAGCAVGDHLRACVRATYRRPSRANISRSPISNMDIWALCIAAPIADFTSARGWRMSLSTMSKWRTNSTRQRGGRAHFRNSIFCVTSL